MSSTTTNLKNINFMSESRYDSLSEIHDDELYAVKIDGLDGEQLINQNPNEDPVKVWTGTRAEYNAIATKNPDTIYHITDDDNITQSLLEMIYPVGSIYIGTMNICPLSALFGTWEKVSSGRVLQGADENHNPGTTIEAGLPQHTHGETFQFSSFTNGRPLYKEYGVSSAGSGNIPSKSLSSSLNCNSVASENESDILQTRIASDSIYGNSDTVQPPAFVVNIWRRVG